MAVQLSNRETWNKRRSLASADFFTIGYSGRSIESFVDRLTSVGIVSLVDVRFTPVSMYKPQFSKQNLRHSLEASGVAYVHLPELGVPRDVRGLAIGKPDRLAIWEWYDDQVAAGFARRLNFFFNALDHPVAFMCVELDPTECHRHRLCLALEQKRLRGFEL